MNLQRFLIITAMKNIIISLVYLFPLLLSAQTGYLTIRGKVVDDATQTAIPNATVYTTNKGVITQSNADGVYELKLQAPTPWRLNRVLGIRLPA